MGDVDLNDALKALRAAPGPTPWYATRPPWRHGEPLRWCEAMKGAKAGTLLLDASGAVLLGLPSYSRPQLISPTQLFCSYRLKDGVAIRLFDTDALSTPFANSIGAASEKAARLPTDMMWASGLLWEGMISHNFQTDRFAYSFPRWLANVEELLFLENVGGTKLYRLLPKRHEIVVYPQDWFNRGDYDFGYQWPMVVAREVRSQAIVGYGLRMGVFVLNSSLSSVEAWLRNDAFALYLNPLP